MSTGTSRSSVATHSRWDVSNRVASRTSPPPTNRSVVPRRFVEPRLGRTAVGAPQLDEPQAGRELLRQVQHQRRAVLTERVDGRGQRSGRVDDDEVAFVEELREVVCVRVHDAQVVAVGDHHPDRVARDAARFGGCGRFPYGRHHRTSSDDE